jgi:hypothetical protein
MADNSTEFQSEAYKHVARVDELGDLPGSNLELDALEVIVIGGTGVEDSTGTRVNPATEATLTKISEALATNDGDAIVVTEDAPLDVSAAALEVGSWSAGVLAIQEDAALDVSGETVPVDQQGVVDISSRDGRTLGDVEVTDLPDHDEAFENGTSLSSGGSLSIGLAAEGAEELAGKISRETASYDVTIQWLDAPGGSVLFTTSVATGVAAGTETDINQSTLYSPYLNVVVADAGGGSGAVTATYNLV